MELPNKSSSYSVITRYILLYFEIGFLNHLLKQCSSSGVPCARERLVLRLTGLS